MGAEVDEIAVLYIDSVFSDRLLNTPTDQVDAPDTGISVRPCLLVGRCSCSYYCAPSEMQEGERSCVGVKELG